MKRIKLKQVVIERYNNEERNFKRERTAFNAFEVEELLGEQTAFDIYTMFAKKLNIKDKSIKDITVISINIHDLDNELKALQNELYEQAKTVSGDDDAYDYFPDLVYAFAQICEEFDRKDIYNETVERLNELLEYNAGEELYLEEI